MKENRWEHQLQIPSSMREILCHHFLLTPYLPWAIQDGLPLPSVFEGSSDSVALPVEEDINGGTEHAQDKSSWITLRMKIFVENPWFERVVMAVICVNCVTLAMFDPNDRDCLSDRCEAVLPSSHPHFPRLYFSLLDSNSLGTSQAV